MTTHSFNTMTRAMGVEKIHFDSISENDMVLFQTMNGVYQFRVTDPTLRSGILTGGGLGDQQREAVLIGSLIDDAYHSGLAVRSRAIFWMCEASQCESLMTSELVGLTLVRDLIEQRRAA
ncbi:MAG: hypothetical protein AB1631_21270 [Acidobacteriota bacterium]